MRRRRIPCLSVYGLHYPLIPTLLECDSDLRRRNFSWASTLLTLDRQVLRYCSHNNADINLIDIEEDNVGITMTQRWKRWQWRCFYIQNFRCLWQRDGWWKKLLRKETSLSNTYESQGCKQNRVGREISAAQKKKFTSYKIQLLSRRIDRRGMLAGIDIQICVYFIWVPNYYCLWYTCLERSKFMSVNVDILLKWKTTTSLQNP